MKPIRVLIVDDEPPARRKLKGFLSQEEAVEVVGEARNGLEALSGIRSLKPDLVLLDVQMPEMDGFRVLEELSQAERPFIVFTTAYDQYALRAFEVSATDYLLKPFDRDRFKSMLEKVRGQLFTSSMTTVQDRVESLLKELRAREGYLERVAVKSRESVVFLRVETIDWIQSAANYLELHVGKKTYLLRDTMKHIESRLDPGAFVRVHRSIIVNLDRIREVQPWAGGDSMIVLVDGTRLRMSRGYRGNFPL